MEVQVRYATEFGSSATVINVTEIPSFAKRFKLLSVNPHEEQTDLKPSTKLHIGEVVDESYPEEFRKEAPKTGSLTEAIKEVINNQLKEIESLTLEEAAKRYDGENAASGVKSFIAGAKWYAETRGKEEVNDLLEMLKRSIAEINHIKYTYKDKGHCVKYLSDCETIIEQYKNK